MQWCEFQDGALIISEGATSEFVYRILTGEVEIFTERTGERIVLGTVRPVEFLGEMSIIERRPPNASARAKGPVTAEQLERWELEARRLLELDTPLVLPAYEAMLKCSHLFNVLDARGAFSVTERAANIQRVRRLACSCADAWVAKHAAEDAVTP